MTDPDPGPREPRGPALVAAAVRVLVAALVISVVSQVAAAEPGVDQEPAAGGKAALGGVERPGGASADWDLCGQAISAAERAAGVPRHLLRAIAIAESGRRHPDGRSYVPWPWTINAAGEGRFLASKREAATTVRSLRDQDIRNIDVGCMQVNLQYHPRAFASVEDALDPGANTEYAARFLASLFQRSGSWGNAVARYHASVYRLNLQYRNRVLRIWHSLRQR